MSSFPLNWTMFDVWRYPLPTKFGTKNFLVRDTFAGLAQDLTLICDGNVVELPEGAEGIIICNVDSFVST